MHSMWSHGVIASVFLIVSTTAVGSTSAAETYIPSGDPRRGREVFSAKGCRICHSVRGAGGRSGPDLAEALVHKGVFAIGASMWSHAPQMSETAQSKGTVWPLLTPDDVRDLLTYLLLVGFAVEPGSSARGEIVFREKGCAKCHTSNGGIGPPLAKLSYLDSPMAVAQDMWNHSVPMAVVMKGLGIAWPLLDENEMADLVAFLRGARAPAGLPDTLPGDPAIGKTLFHAKGCARCHLPHGGRKSPGPDLSTSYWYKTSTQLVAVMWNHLPQMTATAETLGIEFPRFSRNELADVISYVYVLRSSEKVGNARRGRTTFAEKHCSRCHTKGGRGPDLRKSPALASPAHLGSAMWNHAPAMRAAMESEGLEWPLLTGDDVANLVAFLRQ